MADKDINVHVAAKGADQAKQDLDTLAKSTERLGAATKQAGDQTSGGTEKMRTGFELVKGAVSSLVGPLGIGAIVTGLVAAGKAVLKFYDDLKAKNDEAVRQVQQLRGAYEGLFEATGSFSEEQRKQVAMSAANLLAQTRVSKEVGLPVIEAYTRQFKDSMTSGEFGEGLGGMLGYSARHGGPAAVDMISLMRNFGLTTAAQQGEFRRMASQASDTAGIQEEDLMNILGRGMPIIKAMNWSYQEAMANAAVIAQGEIGRARSALPATTFEAMSNPQEEAAKKYGIRGDSRQIFEKVHQKSLGMDQTARLKMLQDIYGGAAPGMAKLMAADKTAVTAALQQAAGPQGAAAEAEEERQRYENLESIMAGAENRAEYLRLQGVDLPMAYQQAIRTIGAEGQKIYQRKQPVRQWWREFFREEEAEKENAAFRMWVEQLTPEEKQEIRSRPRPYDPSGTSPYSGEDPFRKAWRQMSPQQQFEELPKPEGVTINNYIFNNNKTINTKEPAGTTRTGDLP